MENSKLIKIVDKLNSKEKRRFSEFLNSPYFNKNEKLVELFELVIKHLDAFTNGKKNMEDAYNHLYPKNNFKPQKIRYLMSDLTKLLEQFMIISEFENNSLYSKHLLLTSYNKKNLDKNFQATFSIAIGLNNKRKLKDTEFYYYKYLFEYDQYNYISFKNNRKSDRNLKNVIDNLELFYLAKQLKFHCEAVNRRNILAESTDDLETDEYLNKSSKSKFSNEPIIIIYYSILKTLHDSNNEDHFNSLKQKLEKYQHLFPAEELKDMYGFLLNYCIKQLNNGNTKYLSELFKIYNLLLDKKIIFEGKYITPHHLKNIITVGLRLHEFEKTEHIINKYQNFIEKQHKEDIYNFNMALLYFYKKQYSNTLKFLNLSHFSDIYYQLDSKVLLLKAYYEVNETEALFSLIDSFKVFLRRNKSISDYQKSIYFNFINFVNILTKQKLFNKHDINEIINNIKQTKKVADINWLLEKAEELKI